MTPTQLFLAGALGSVAAALGLTLCARLTIRLSCHIVRTVNTVHERKEQRRRRRDLDTCRAILALPTIDHPTEPP